MQNAVRNNKQKGLTIIEAIIAIGLLLFVVGLAIVFFGQGDNSTKSLATQQQITALTASVKAVAPGPDYTGVTAAVLVAAKKVPSDMVSGTNIVNKFGGTVTIAAATYPTGAAANNAFTMTQPQLPTSVCNDAVSKNLSQYPRITVNGTAVQDLQAATPVLATPATISAACATDANSVVLTRAG